MLIFSIFQVSEVKKSFDLKVQSDQRFIEVFFVALNRSEFKSMVKYAGVSIA